MTFSQGVAAAALEGVQLPAAEWNTVVAYGQSLAEGQETWPSLSREAVPGTFMLGDNVDCVSVANVYKTIGAAVLNPLVARTNDGSANLTEAEEAALAPGSNHHGEPPVIGMTRQLKIALNRATLSDSGRNLVALSAGVGGKTIEQLSKTNTQDTVNRYGILTDGLGKVQALTGAGTHVMTALLWIQGGYNYANFGGSWDGASYAALMQQLFDDIAADARALTGQALPPLFLTAQTSGQGSADVDSSGTPGRHVSQAQLEVALSRADTVMVGPTYAVTDKGAHLDSNGARWFGHMAAKVARRVLIDRQGWQPLRPIEITRDRAVIHVHFHVPVPPLRFDTPYVETTAMDYDDKGFKVTSADAQTTYEITAVEIVGQTIIRITLATEPPADALLWYGDKTDHDGGGCVFDSDPGLATDTYEYVPERGMYAGAEIAALIGKPYPLANPSIVFCYPLTYSEF